MLGEFKLVVTGDDRSPIGRVLSCFQVWVNRKGLINLSFNGPRFTWNHGIKLQRRKSARLDRELADMSWQQRFLEARVTHCPHAYSDHYPVLLNTQGNEVRPVGERPFRFEAAWLSHRHFLKLTKDNLNKGSSWLETIAKFTKRSSKTVEHGGRQWNMEGFW